MAVLAVATAHQSDSIGSTISGLLHSAGQFFAQLANLSWGSLLLGLALYGLYLLLRSRALWAAVQAAYPDQRVRWRDVWGGYMVGYAVNNVFPLGGGNIAQLFLTRIAIPDSSYPAIAAALSTGVVFDWFVGLLVMAFAFTQGVFPKPPDFSKLHAFDISFFASNMRFTLFFLTVLGVAFLVGFALLSARVRAFWQRIRQGLTILRNRDRWRAGSWPAGSRGSPPTGPCWTPSTSVARSATCCWCWRCRSSRRCFRSRPAAPVCSRHCC
jgi:uncharacterized membrane protein YbhN (UPF0104 family)